MRYDEQGPGYSSPKKGKEKEGRRGKKKSRPFTCGTWSIKCLLRTNGNGDPEAPVDVDPDCEVAIDEEVDEECEEDWPSVGEDDDEGKSDRLIRAIRVAMAS